MVPAGANAEVRGRYAGEAKGTVQRGFIDVLSAKATGLDLLGQGPGRIHDIPATAIVRGDHEGHARVVGGKRFRVGHELLQVIGEAASIADDLHPHSLSMEFVHIFREDPTHQRHEKGHFPPGAEPVFRGKGEKGDDLHPELRRPLRHGAHGAGAGAMARGPRQVALLRPTMIAIHDDGHVTRRRSVLELRRCRFRHGEASCLRSRGDQLPCFRGACRLPQ